MVYIVVALVAVVTGWTVLRTGSLNKDPRQQTLAKKMLESVEEGRAYQELRYPGGSRITRTDDPLPLEFSWGRHVVPYFNDLYGHLPLRQQQTRAAHALSMIRTTLTPDEYELLSRAYCRTLYPSKETAKL